MGGCPVPCFRCIFKPMKTTRILPYLSWIAIGLAASILFALLVPDRSFFPAFSDGLMIAGTFILAIAWLLHLKQDGVRVFPPRAPKSASSVPSWQDRVPEPGKAPPEPAPLPGPEGPDSQAYARLSEAEARLREKISGTDGGEEKKNKDQARKSVQQLAFSGLALFALSLLFQYVVRLA